MSLPRRQWFQPGDSIAREVISADIQRYLGPDATVRPGVGTGEYEGLEGYWITAYKTLTSSQVQDLKQDSERWLSERRQGGREYNQSHTHAQRQQYGPSEPVRHAEYAVPSQQPTYSYHAQDQSQYTYQQQPQAAYSYPSQTYQQQPRTAGYSYPPQAPSADPRYAQQSADPRYYQHQQAPSAAPSQYPPQSSSSYSHYQEGSRASYPSQPAYTPAYPQGYSQQQQYQQYQQPPSSGSSRSTRR